MKLLAVSFFYLALVFAYETTPALAKEQCKRRKVKCLKSKSSKSFDNSTSKAVKFMMKTDAEYLKLMHEASIAQYAYDTNTTDYNKNIMAVEFMKLQEFITSALEEGSEFEWKTFKRRNQTLYRWFFLFLGQSTDELEEEEDFRLLSSKAENQKSMADIFQQARVCPYKSKEKNCALTLEPDLKTIMGTSRDPDELEHIWTEFRDKTGKLMRNIYVKEVTFLNKMAEEEGYSDFGQKMMNNYEVRDFSQKMLNVLNDIVPLYKQLHAFVRRKLIKYYGKKVKIKDNGPIPAHLFGDMYAQLWSSIFDIVNPFPEKNKPNVTETLQRKEKKPIDLFIMAERFFVSLGLPKMTPYFWVYSMLEKPTDRDVVCHATAYDLRADLDFRIKMCTVINSEYLNVVHHEMGHIEYYMLYKHQPTVFRTGANFGFHEAVGEVVTLSASTYDYQKKVLFQDEEFEEDEETDIIHLLDVALKYIPSAMYTYIIDTYRYGVYNGSIKLEDLNHGWWSLRLKYQGICPPRERTEKDFDPGAKYHMAMGIEYMRYFFANVLAFQMHKSVCEAAGHSGPLHKCSIYENKAAGKLLKKVLSIGKSKHWQEVMKILTNSETSELTSDAYLEYFKPLYDWLEKENKDEEIGWESDDPLACP